MRGWVGLAFRLALVAAAGCGVPPEHEVDRLADAAVAALRRGALQQALDHVEAGARLAPGGSIGAHRLRLIHADVLLSKPDLAGADRLLEPDLPDDPAFEPLHVYRDYLRARAQVAHGRLRDALDALAVISSDTPEAAGTRLEADIFAAQVLLRVGRFAEGEARLARAADEAAARGDRYRQMLAWNTRGMGLLVRNRLDEAVSWFEQVLTFEDLNETSVYAIALNNAGACYARLGSLERAVAVQRRAVSLHEHRGSAAPYEQALGELGSTYLLLDDAPQAVAFLSRAMEVASNAGLRTDAAIWARNLAAAYVESGRWEDAERANEQARRLTPAEDDRKLAFNTLHAANIARGRGRDGDARRLFEQALTEAAAEPSIRWAAHEGLAGLARHAGDNASAAAHLEAALQIIEKTRSDLLKTDYRLSFITRLIRFYREYIEVLVAGKQIERALLVADSSRGRVLAERHGVAPPRAAEAGALRRLAAASSATLVSYWLAPARSYMWIVDGGGVRLRELPAAREIERLVREHQAAIHNALADPAAPGGAGEKLFELLVAPFSSAVPPGGSVIVVGDGALHGLNFETLPMPGAAARRYWIEHAAIQMAPSLALLTAKRGTAPPPSLLLVGNPAPRDAEFPALRYASAEMKDIRRHFEGRRAAVYEGEAATPDAYRRAAPEAFSLVHFTAHAAANADSPLDSAVILSGPAEAHKLYARDAAELPIRAELVTVSACRGAGERAFSGEGLVGFAWAFLRAGARRVVAGLWDVDDRSTAELMSALYARLAAGDPPAQALREAKLQLLRRRGDAAAKPYYWAPFQLYTVSIP